MKKLVVILSALALISSCAKMELAEPLQKGESNDPATINSGLPEVLYVSVADEHNPKTRTVAAGKKILWQKDDAISYFALTSHNVKYAYTGVEPASNVKFNKVEDGTESGVIKYSRGVYPYAPNTTVVYDNENLVEKINVTYPATQTYAQNSFGPGANLMVATGDDNDDDKLFFRNTCGYLVIKLYGAGTVVKSITVSSLSGVDKIAGTAVIVTDNEKLPVVTMSAEASTAVTLDCTNGGEGVALAADKADATEFWFALPPVNFKGGIKINVTDINEQSYTMQTTKSVNITRNNVQPMAALEFVSNTPASNKIWYTKTSAAMAGEGGKNPTKFYDDAQNPFDATIKTNGHYYDEAAGKFVIEFTTPVTTINAYAFRDTQIETITLPEGLVTIENEAFRHTPLKEITIPGSVNTIGQDAFYDCDYLTSVTFLPSATQTPLNIWYQKASTYEYGAFYDSPLSYINLNRELVYNEFNLDSWKEGIFASEDYESVASVTVTIGNQVRTIDDYMFAYLNIKNLTIPANVESIGRNAFDGCSKLATLTFEESETPLVIKGQGDSDGPFYDSPLSTIDFNRNFTYMQTDGETPRTYSDDSDGIFAISTSARNQVTSLPSKVNIGGLIRNIPDRMFCNLPITDLVVPGTVTTIGNDVFNGCTRLSSIVFNPDEADEPVVLTIGYNADGTDEGLFLDSPLTTIKLNRELNYTFASESGTIDSSSEGLFNSKSTITSVTLGSQVRTLSPYLFANTQITSINIPANVISIGRNAFDGCSKLATLTFEESETPLVIKGQGDSYGPFYDSPLTTINYYRNFDYMKINDNPWTPSNDSEGIFAISTDARDKVSAISTVNIGGLIKDIPHRMFCNLPITKLTIPGTVTYIGNDVFNGCTRLNLLTFEPSETTPATNLGLGYNSDGQQQGPFLDSPLTHVSLNREIEYALASKDYLDAIDEGIFSQKKNLAEVTIGAQVKTLSDFMFAESGTSVLAGISFVINEGVETIGEHVFNSAELTQITIPASVTEIKNYAFHYCTELSSVTFASSTTPLTMGFQPGSDDVGPFYQSPLATINLNRQIVPSATYEEELDAWDMGVFANRHYADDALTTTVNIGANVTSILPWMFSGVRVHNIWIPENVTSIGNYAFLDCRRLNDVTMGHHTPPAIGTGVFDSCDIFRYIVVRKSALDKYKVASDWDAYEVNFFTKDDF